MLQLQEMKRHLTALSKANEDIRLKKDQDNQIVKELDTKLSTVQIKITEEEENRENYEQAITHLKIDDLRDKGLIELRRKEVHEGDELAKKTNELKLRFKEEQDR